ncbi:YpdA family putative bacillithiol disulfide reductase [Flavobacterium sp. NKUCC04_CG]|uniref:YpdA family putative bacillithiol disulfide reductase n=1 Tax=Flavobacterium sp. NKUCC04_CG TaxID=2842121 RepID=UPI001C5B5B78|nr:YpdA family putative bacillithiol disulfide reductase [Flavobacterium sp. NKUCC04_CG]MBW3517592.1 YpdA family putative bacillithiol disulfide reductase [Flavobacterium sp. NKUCC04_CG]
MNHFYDIIIIGAGPIGIACALEAKKKNKSYLILEKGCLVNSLYHYPTQMQFFSSSELLELDNIPFTSIENRPKRNEALEYYRRIVESRDLKIQLFEEVLGVYKTDFFNIQTTKANYTATQVIVATGFYDVPNYLHVPGEELTKVAHYYKDPHYYAQQKVVVVGGSNSSVDAALECYRKGAKVTMVIRDKAIGSHVKYWVRPDIENRISEGSIQVFYESHLTEIYSDRVSIATPNGLFELANDFVLALIGYRPNIEFLERIGVCFSSDSKKVPAYDPQSMETNIKGLYLAGVVCGGLDTHQWFIENSRIHAKQILNHIDNGSTPK